MTQSGLLTSKLTLLWLPTCLVKEMPSIGKTKQKKEFCLRCEQQEQNCKFEFNKILNTFLGPALQ